jgi:hypothetical protein
MTSYRIQYSRLDHDYTCYVTIDDVEQTIGSRPDHAAAEKLCREYLFDHFSDAHTPEVAVRFVGEPTGDFLSDAPGCPGCGATNGTALSAECSHPLGCGFWRERGARWYGDDSPEVAAFEPEIVDPCAPLGPCASCGADAWTAAAGGLFCPEHEEPFVTEDTAPEPSEPAFCHCSEPAAWEVRDGLLLTLVCEECYQNSFVNNKLLWSAWEATELPRFYAASSTPDLPGHALPRVLWSV